MYGFRIRSKNNASDLHATPMKRFSLENQPFSDSKKQRRGEFTYSKSSVDNLFTHGRAVFLAASAGLKER